MGEVCLLNPISNFQDQDKSFLDISNSYNRSPGFVEQSHMFAPTSPFEAERSVESPVDVEQSMFESPPYENESMEQVQQLIVKEVMKDITVACQYLNIPQDPQYWTHEQVEKWVLWTFHHYGMQPANMECFSMNGYQLCMLSDINFRHIDPRCGDILYAHLDIWKTAAKMYPVPQMQPSIFMQPEIKPEEYMYVHPSDNISTGSNSDDEVSLPSPTASGPNTSMTPNHKGGIHLWQFLKELLLQPDSYSYCIRWLNRTEGIFKIEDSVEVARLWGLRKNRPAMNYDKLSRSIRQYYKKGIMKKTEVSQRLVYQFVHPC
ncbi:SAM pointed domain-containing Ets transcription factor-like [Anneissia japonica]|uniref:SAM pointed domain-containing Ets transcription factor-like n=1 Tax=Anneissia japonica TaxID=1529436 RepID=UPI0014254C1C|nr:SAM pointed domain-containing Ets transcription factor-like [Anneissia japonica]